MEWRRQLTHVFRRLRRAPMFTAVTLLTLAVGVGANTAVFSVLEGVLLKPLPYPHQEELIGVWLTAPGMNLPELELSPSDYFTFREQGQVFRDVGVFYSDYVTVTGVAEPERDRVLRVTDGVLPILGVQPLLGRVFTSADSAPNAPIVVLLMNGYWRQKYGSDPKVIGRTIRMGGNSYEIVGVMPPEFRFLDYSDVSLLLPAQFDRNTTNLGDFSYQGIARLKPGVGLEGAIADVARMLPIVMRSFPPPPEASLELLKQAGIAPKLRPLKQDVVGDVGKLLWVLMASIGMVLLIACANVANLLLVRAQGRQSELTVRAALGASRGRIAGELLVESFVLGILGSLLGLALAFGALKFLVYLAPAGLPRIEEIGVNLPVLLFTLGVSLFASLFFGLIPVVKYAGARAGISLREGGRSLSQSRERHRAQNTLVVVQVGLAFVLLISSGLLIRTFWALTRVNPGFAAPWDVATFDLGIPPAEVTGEEAVVRREEAIVRKLAAIPSVQSVGLTTALPMSGGGWRDAVYAQDKNYAEGEIPPIRVEKFVSPEFFGTLGIPLVAGRNLTWTDTYNAVPVALISENFAREYWGSASNALGKRIRAISKDDWREIIGVVGNVRDDGVNQEAPASIYFPLLLKNFETRPIDVRREVSVVMRTPLARSASFMSEVRQAVWAVDANQPLANMRPLGYYYAKSMARTSFTLVMLGIAAGMALLLGSIGLYGVIAYSVSQRTHEVGIRMALGAQPGELAAMFVRQGLWLTAGGMLFGVAVAMATVRLMASLLFQVSPGDPITYAAVCIGLTATAALASYLPSRRVAGVDPVEALRRE